MLSCFRKPFCTVFASKKQPSIVIPVLVSVPTAIPVGMLIALPVGFPFVIMLLSPFTTSYSCPEKKEPEQALPVPVF